MELQSLWRSAVTDLRTHFLAEHLNTSSRWYAATLAAWSVTQWLGDESYWIGVGQAVAVHLMNLVGMYAILITLIAMPAMRFASSIGFSTERPNQLALHAANRFRDTYKLGAISIGVVLAQLTLTLWFGPAPTGPEIALLIFIALGFCTLVCMNAVMWLAARTLDVGRVNSPLLAAIP